MNRRLAVTLMALALGVTACSSTPDELVAAEIAVTGDITVHDPALVVGAEGEPWYVFSTGDIKIGNGAPQIRRSVDEGATWESIGTVWDKDTRPSWAYEKVPLAGNFWAPEVVEHEGTWYLYYSVSTFGSNSSAIGLATNSTLDPDDPAYAWVDQGEVWSSAPGDNYNAIDPGVITDAEGTGWMAFGSFWGGIQLLELEWPSGKPVAGAEPVVIADRGTPPNAIEAPYLVEREGWYYLFVSRDSCCSGVASTYNMAVGRSKDITGPYLGPDGMDMAADGGLSLLSTTGDLIGPGGQSVSDGVLAFHYYDGANDGIPTLALRELAWDDEGWPVALTAEELAAD